MLKTWISQEQDKILRNWERISKLLSVTLKINSDNFANVVIL